MKNKLIQIEVGIFNNVQIPPIWNIFYTNFTHKTTGAYKMFQLINITQYNKQYLII